MDVSQDEDIDEYEQLTTSQVLQRLNEAWINEKLSPNLLESQQEVIDCLLEQCKVTEDNFENASPFAVGVHQLEIQRIKYVATDYLRTRIKKIEKNTEYYLEDEKDSETSSKLSPAEFIFARDLYRNTHSYLNEVALKHMPAAFQNLDKRKSVTKPNLNTFVFFKVKEDCDDVLIDPRESPVDLTRDEIHISKFYPISTLLEDGKVKLF